ncbi:hypothetical protein HHI36_008266 [Cryptolaemus montrouzieri]|uniref:Uncharacterized protein n=1 Tax=Cryptolaemus montrouzieri TaxID=559131 RepID=A0ABD2MS73_9CUCU
MEEPNKENLDEKNKGAEVKYDPIIPQIMECFIMDTLRSPIFQEMVNCQQRATPPYYLQFKQDEPKSKSQARKEKIQKIRKYFTKPPMRDLSDVFKFMIKDTIQQIYF